MDLSGGAGVTIGAMALSAGWVTTFWLVQRHRYRMKRLDVEKSRFEAARSQEELRREILDFLESMRVEMHSVQGGVAEKLQEVNERVDLTERMLLRASRARFAEQRESAPA